MNRYKSYLRKRPQYSEMINEVEIGPTDIKYPDRTATFMRNSHYLSRFDGDSSFINLEEQQNNILKQQILEATRRQMGQMGQGIPVFTPRTEYFRMSSDGGRASDVADNISDMDDFSDINTEAEERAQSDFFRQQQTAGLFPGAVNTDDLAEEVRAASNQDLLNQTAEERGRATKREGSLEAESGKQSKTQKVKQVSKILGAYRNKPRSRSPLRADPEETQRIRIRSKSAPARSKKGVPPPVPPPGPPPQESSSSSSYPTLNKEKAKERVGGSIRVKQPTGAAAAAADAYEEEAAPGTYDIPPSKMGIQNLFELLKNAINKGKLSNQEKSKYDVAIQKFDLGVQAKSQKLKDDAKDELRDIYRRLFYKKPKF